MRLHHQEYLSGGSWLCLPQMSDDKPKVITGFAWGSRLSDCQYLLEVGAQFISFPMRLPSTPSYEVEKEEREGDVACIGLGIDANNDSTSPKRSVIIVSEFIGCSPSPSRAIE
ncbi:hypothetical protein K1719_014712 [Acacia pycnantha]|nr:hypothetical protein K1719_014712 [Acacia pycnantha]